MKKFKTLCPDCHFERRKPLKEMINLEHNVLKCPVCEGIHNIAECVNIDLYELVVNNKIKIIETLELKFQRPKRWDDED